jgi:hypothetical protein
MSWLRISVVVYCVAVAALATLMVLRLGNEELAVKFILSIALLGALAGIIFFGWTFGDWFDHRRRLRAALRLAERMQSGERLPRAESLGAPFVGPPAADLLVVVGVGIGALMSRSGLPREGAFVGLMSMLAFVVALAQRRKLQLALPFTNRRAKPFLLPMVAASMLLVFLAPRTGLEDLLRVGGLGFALTFYYMASVGLAEEAVMAKSDIIERDGRPVSYWLHIFLYVVSAFAAAGAVLLLPEFR